MSDMKKKIAALKDEAATLMHKGNLDKAIKVYTQVLQHAPKEPHVIMKIGDCYVRLKDTKNAINYYNRAADIYEHEGFVVKAIAVIKLMLKHVPNSPELMYRLTTLYEDRINVQKPELKIREFDKETVEDAEVMEEEQPIARIALFSDFNQEEFLAVMEKLRHIDVGPDETVISQEDTGKSIFVIASGEVAVYREDNDGNEVWVTNLHDGDFFGEFGFFSESKRNATVKSTKETTLLELTKEDVNDLINDHPHIREVLFRFYKERVLDILLAVSPIFSILPPEKRRELVAKFTPSFLRSGEIIVTEGEVGDQMYIIQTGEVEMTTEREGEKISLARLKAGDFFGEVSLLTGKPRTATAVATTDVRLASISREDIRGTVKEYPEILEIIKKHVKLRMDDTITTIMQYKNRRDETGLL
jgi:cAMP-dependent protein kinase regulator